jgi:hypothetical protein
MTKNLDLRCFLISSKTPQWATLKRYQYEKSRYAGVFYSKCPICSLFPIISLNDLSDSSHNVLFKLFASKKKAYIDAMNIFKRHLFHKFSENIRGFVIDFMNNCLIKGDIDMDYLNMTEEDVQKLRMEMLSNYSASEVITYFKPSELLSNMSKSDILSNMSASDILSNMSASDILSNMSDQIVNGLSNDQLETLAKQINRKIASQKNK